jgi:iron complex outermembrane receptor protein
VGSIAITATTSAGTSHGRASRKTASLGGRPGAGAGGDWIDSSNLGERRYGRVSAFAEAQTPLASRATLHAGLRVEEYSTFGRAWTPSMATAIRAGERLRLRLSASRAFRIPTFTELYYRDPAHAARSSLSAEHGWSLDGGADWRDGAWHVAVSPFVRWDANVIDWVREQPTHLWQTTNVRDVTTRGVELSVYRQAAALSLTAHYGWLDVSAPRLTLLSKYVLEYARHSAGLAVATPSMAGWRLIVRADHRRRVSGDAYSLVGARLSRRVGRADLYVDGANLFDVAYVEVPGVSMPGRWLTAGVVYR